MPVRVTFMANEKQSTRNTILNLVKKNGEMTIKQLSDVLGITSMGVRQHLESLEKEELIQCRMERQKVGRPVQIFSLTESANKRFPSGYEPLVLGLLQDLEALDGPEKVHQLLHMRKEGLAKEYRAKMLNADDDDRFAILAQMRDLDGYMCEALKGEDGKLCIVEHHCPISEVARKFPEICSIEHALFEEALDTRLQRHEHIMNGDKCCKYIEEE
ncbi:MAG: transcriptional regulator [Planctomycetota bacterium]|nr:transcriptional regulator [Planctomycetota bacterium]MDA1139953.1 transcriptional regulator [Planctomycetota bacterium]